MRVRPQVPPADVSEIAEEIAETATAAATAAKSAVELPDELVYAIFAECDPDDLPSLIRHGRVNRQWHRVSQDERLYRHEAPPANWPYGRGPVVRPADGQAKQPAKSSAAVPESLRKLGQRILGRAAKPLPTVPAPKRPEPPTTSGQRYQAWLASLTPQQRIDVAKAYNIGPYFAFDFAGEHRADADVCWALVSRYGDAITKTRFKDDPSMWRLALSNAGFVMEEGDDAQRRCIIGARLAVANHPPAVRFLDATLKDNLEVGLLAIQGDPATLEHLSPRLQAHPEILALVARTPKVDTDWNFYRDRCKMQEWYG